LPIVIAIAIAAFVAWFDLGPGPEARALVFATVAFVTVLNHRVPLPLLALRPQPPFW